MAILKVLPFSRIIRAPDGACLLSILREAGIGIAAECGGQGRCGRCRIRFLEAPPPITKADTRFFSSQELESGWRLACQHCVINYCLIEIPTTEVIGQSKLKSSSLIYQFALRPIAAKMMVPLISLNQELSRLELLQLILGGKVEISPFALSQLASLKEDLCTLTIVGRKVVAVEPGEAKRGPYGVAIDVGTTTVAAYLLDLGLGKEIGARVATNAQCAFGVDILSRISYIQERGLRGLQELHRAVVTTINFLVEELAQDAGITSHAIVQVAIVGNPTMLHLLVGVNPTSIGQAPFIPVWRRMLTFRAGELSLGVNPEALVYILPFVSGYVGADVVAGILACELDATRGIKLYIDLGTNSEIVLAIDGKLLACAAAGGPAFEGMNITCGMPAWEGAIFRVEISKGEVHYRTIGDVSPRGICGTGLIDLVASLLEAGLIDSRGRFQREGKEARQIRAPLFILSEDPLVYITQEDIRKLQLAKAAIRAGIEVLANQAGISLEEIEQVFLAGAFGSEINVRSLARIGVLPAKLLPRIIFVGNAAGEGAKACLFDQELVQRAEQIAHMIEYIELSRDKRFIRYFINALSFPARM